MRAHLGLGLFALFGMGGLAACGSGSHHDDINQNGPESHDLFESDDPSLGSGSPGGGWDDGAGGNNAGAPPSDGGNDAEREIAEADIVQLRDNRLYALSRTGGLSIIDVGTRDELRLLGRFRIQATPFEMYVRGDLVIAMFTDWGRYVYDEATKSHRWVQTSEVVALDVRDPSNIRELHHFEIPGEISDSRVVGDILYVVSYRDGYCWGCGTQPKTLVTSIDVSDPTSIRRVDELDFPSKNSSWGWAKRSVTVTPKRMYVAGPEWSYNGDSRSTIQVVDIEDPRGDLVLGASVKAAGTISSRWQMDEHEGVLRVISQPDQWDLSKPPMVQTFEIASSSELSKIGYLNLKLPRPEQLRSVRFDGNRAYAITFERTDPLFTIDLSNPEIPLQKGELEMPGWVHHMEPRGDRLYGLGFDNGNKQGSLNVSIFDVSDLSNPTMLDRVNFGGDWSYLGEDQNRIHKAFQILPDAGLILVPFSGYRNQQGCGGYTSGVQLIDLVGDSLKKRAQIPTRGEARRAFLHDDRLFAVSEDRAQVFDIGNRDVPKSKATLKLAHRVDRVISAGDKLLRIAMDWWTGAASLEVVRKDDASRYEPLGSVDLDDQEAGASHPACGYNDYRFAYARIFAQGKYVYIVVPSLYSNVGKQGTMVLVVDIGNPTAPRIVKREQYPFRFSPYVMTGEKGFNSVIEAGDYVVQIGDSIAILEDGYDPYAYDPSEAGAFVHILDFRDPERPRHSEIRLPAAKGRTALQAHGKTLMLSRWSPVPDKPGRVRFYVDRVDVTKPSAPVLLPSVNVPGSLLSFDAAGQRFVTVDYRREVFASRWDDRCKGGFVDYANETCTLVHRTLNLVGLQGDGAKLVENQKLATDSRVSKVERGDDRVFLIENHGYYDCGPGCGGYGDTVGRVVAIGGARTGKLQVSDTKVGGNGLGLAHTSAAGQRLIVSSGWNGNAGLIDFSDIYNPEAVKLGQVRGSTQDIAVDQKRAFFALGENGVQSFEIGD